jgi:hypothetical protein
MKAAKVSEIKKDLTSKTQPELLDLCLHLAKFKKENKELLTYLLYESDDEASFIQSIKEEVDEQFLEINTSSYYFIKKSMRKILRNIKKHIRYSKNKETEVELLIYYCGKLNSFSPSIKRSTALINLYQRQLISIRKTVSSLHEDLQYDFGLQLEELN